jgi:pimeloyl-ACP methyl ester carboxylesterase
MELSAYHPFRSVQAQEQYLASYDLRAKQWPVASETRMVKTAYGQTFVRISGPADAQPLVLLPGGFATSLMWMSNIEALSASYKSYAVDNIYDNGRSIYTHPLQGPDGFVNWLDDLFTVLDLGDNIHLMGISNGGWLASQYALRFPDRVAKLVLLAPAATVLQLQVMFAIRLFAGGLFNFLLSRRSFITTSLCWIFADLVQKDEAGRMLVDEIADEILLAFQCFKPRAYVNPTVLSDQELHSLKMPTLFLVGEHEKIYSAPRAVRRLNAVAPQIKTEIILQAGHDLAFVQAEVVNRKVLEFLKQS